LVCAWPSWISGWTNLAEPWVDSIRLAVVLSGCREGPALDAQDLFERVNDRCEAEPIRHHCVDVRVRTGDFVEHSLGLSVTLWRRPEA
jgi:hypothetical protein